MENLWPWTKPMKLRIAKFMTMKRDSWVFPECYMGAELWYGILIGCCCFSLIAVVGILLPTLCSVNSLCCLWGLLLQVLIYITSYHADGWYMFMYCLQWLFFFSRQLSLILALLQWHAYHLGKSCINFGV